MYTDIFLYFLAGQKKKNMEIKMLRKENLRLNIQRTADIFFWEKVSWNKSRVFFSDKMILKHVNECTYAFF